MDVREALHARRSTRAFTDREVAPELLTRALTDAAYAPSGGNIQPWHAVVLRGQSLRTLVDHVTARIHDPDAPPPTPVFPVYPSPLKSPYRERRFSNGEELYALLGIPRDDRPARFRQFDRNFRFFDAPVALFLYIDRSMHQPQWADLGMFLQSLLLLLTAEGVDTCPQAAWAIHHEAVAEVLQPPPELMLFCGLAIGYADSTAAINRLRTERAPLAEWCTFLD